MKTMLLAVLLIGAMAVAQTPSVTPNTEQASNGAAPDQSTVKPQTVRGCLNSVGDDYTVIDQVSGKTFKLAGETDRLKQYIGQTVEITGSVKSVDGDSKPASASNGDILTLADVKQVSDKCTSVPNSGALAHEPMILALMQQPVNPDANTQLHSSEQMSSYADDTSAAAANTRSVTTNKDEHAFMTVSGHTGVHGFAATTADTTTVGQTTPPPATAGGYIAKQNDQGVAPVNPQAYNRANVKSEVNRDKNKQSPALNPESIGASEEDGNKAAIAASSAEMHTDATGQHTTYRTQRKSEANGSANANPKETQPPSEDVKTETTPSQPQ
jgi:hypothetical protein